MSSQNKEMVIGDVVKWEIPHFLARVQKNVSRDLTATLPLVVGEMMEPDTAVAQIATFAAIAAAPLADGGTYRLGYKGQWTTDLAWNASAATAKTAFELLSTVTDTITFSAAPVITGTTSTWATAGQKAEIEVDARLLLDGTVSMEGSVMAVSTIGSTAAEVVLIATGASATCILLEKVTLDDLQDKNDISRAFLVKGPSLVDGDNLYAVAAQLAAAKTAMIALGVSIRTEPNIYVSGLS